MIKKEEEMTESLNISWRFEIRKLADIKPWGRNPRRITEKGIKDLAASIAKFGLPEPIVLNLDGTIIGGHARYQVLKKSGATEAVCALPDRMLTERELEELNIRLNKNVAGEFDDDILANNFSLEDLKEWGFEDRDLDFMSDLPGSGVDATAQIDKAEELRAKWGVETGQVWKLGEHRIMCGDSTKAEDVKRVMVGENVDCIFTSPPYGVGVDYGRTYDDNIQNLRAMLPKLSKIWMSLLVEGGFAVINFGDIVSAKKIVGSEEPCEYPMALEYWPVFRADGWALWSRRIWCKPGAGTGSMQCISSNRAATNWEHLWTWKKAGPAMFPKQTTGEYPSQNGWIDSTHSEGLGVHLNVHGAGMPLLPALFSISNHSRQSGLVFEPFSGTGTTIIACERLGRKCRAIEISPGYVAVAIQRWADATGGNPELLK
jgi:DNA modification methylase